MLKTNFDRGRDHLAMFQPFIDDTIMNTRVDGASDADVQQWVAARHQLTLPLSTVRTLLHRASRRGLVRRDSGRYFAGDVQPKATVDLPALRREVEGRQAALADRYREWASGEGTEFESREVALQSLIGFIERNHVRLALMTPYDEMVGVDTAIEDDPTITEDRQAARFLQTTLGTDSATAKVISELLEGYVLQNTLLLADVSTAQRRYSGLRIVFDSGLLFGALGLQGEGQALLTRDLIQLLREEGARPEAFVTTLREMRRVLTVYENQLGTAAGRRALHPTDLTRHFLTTHAGSADVRIISATLETSLADLGLSIVDTPAHVPTFTMDEASLSTKLANRAGGESDLRVVHDVDCVAAVLTIRRGRSSDSLDNAHAIFATSSQMTVRNVVEWYEDDGGAGIPPIIHLLTLSNLTWLKRPGRAATLKLAELIALCAAALRPSRKVWNAFLLQLDHLERSGKVTSDEATAIMASSLTDRLLIDDDIQDDADADSLSEVIYRVRRSLTAEADMQVEAARSEVEQLQQIDLERRSFLANRARQISLWCSWLVAGAAVGSLLLGTIVSVINVVSGEPPEVWAIVLGLVPLAAAGLFGAYSGFNVKDWRRAIQSKISSAIERWLGSAGSAEPAQSDAP